MKMSFLKVIALFLLVGILTPVSFAQRNLRKITLIHFNDLHAHLTTHEDIVPSAPPGQTSTTTRIVKRGGLARSFTLIKQIRLENPNSILMNIGDTYHGGVEALYTVGNAIVPPMEALGVDIGVPGNWDFAYGPAVSRIRYTNQTASTIPLFIRPFLPTISVSKVGFPNLAANVTMQNQAGGAFVPFLPPTMVKIVDGVKIGFIGISSDIVPQMYAPLATGFSFLQGEDNYKTLINTYAASLRSQGARIVVVMSELGIQKDYRLAQIIDSGSVNVFFSAHTHEATFDALGSASGAWVVEAGNDGYVGRMDFLVTVGGKIVMKKWKLMPVGLDTPEDPQMVTLINQARSPFLVSNVNMQVPLNGVTQTLTQPISTVVGFSQGPLDRRSALESTFNDSLTDVLRIKGNTQLAMTPGFRFDSVIPTPGTPLEDNTVASGKIDLEDVYRFFPVPYSVSTGQVTGQRLKEILEAALTSVYSPTIFQQGGGWTDGFSGLTVNLNLNQPDGQKVSEMRLKSTGQIINPTDVFTVTGCTRPQEATDVLCSYSGFTNVQPLINPANSTQWTIADIFVQRLSEGQIPAVTRHDFTDLSGNPVYPQSLFIQPLTGVGSPPFASKVNFITKQKEN